MEKLDIVHTTPNDTPTIHWLFDEAINYQKRKGFIVWQGYDKEQLKNEMENGHQYKVTIDGKLACIFSVFYEDAIIWGEKEDGKSMYLHRIVVNPNFKGRKLFGKILDWAIEEGNQKKLHQIRMDTWAQNDNIISYYESYGFKFVGNTVTSDSKELAAHYRKQPLALLEYDLLKKEKKINSKLYAEYR